MCASHRVRLHHDQYISMNAALCIVFLCNIAVIRAKLDARDMAQTIMVKASVVQQQKPPDELNDYCRFINPETE